MNCSIGCSPRKSCTVTRVTTATPSARRSRARERLPTSRPKPIGAGKLLLAVALPIERMYGRLKDFRRVATRYDRLARNFLAIGLPRRYPLLLVMSLDPKTARNEPLSSFRRHSAGRHDDCFIWPW